MIPKKTIQKFFFFIVFLLQAESKVSMHVTIQGVPEKSGHLNILETVKFNK